MHKYKHETLFFFHYFKEYQYIMDFSNYFTVEKRKTANWKRIGT